MFSHRRFLYQLFDVWRQIFWRPCELELVFFGYRVTSLYRRKCQTSDTLITSLWSTWAIWFTTWSVEPQEKFWTLLMTRNRSHFVFILLPQGGLKAREIVFFISWPEGFKQMKPSLVLRWCGEILHYKVLKKIGKLSRRDLFHLVISQGWVRLKC